jgi:hypothetical protein
MVSRGAGESRAGSPGWSRRTSLAVLPGASAVLLALGLAMLAVLYVGSVVQLECGAADPLRGTFLTDGGGSSTARTAHPGMRYSEFLFPPPLRPTSCRLDPVHAVLVPPKSPEESAIDLHRVAGQRWRLISATVPRSAHAVIRPWRSGVATHSRGRRAPALAAVPAKRDTHPGDCHPQQSPP